MYSIFVQDNHKKSGASRHLLQDNLTKYSQKYIKA